MSEEILKALMQLFAIISKQDNGHNHMHKQYVHDFLSSQISSEKVAGYIELYHSFLNEGDGAKEKKLTSVKDSVKTLSICKKINKTLSHKQKIIVLLRICEFSGQDGTAAQLRNEILETAAKVFNIEKEEFEALFQFASNSSQNYSNHQLKIICGPKSAIECLSENRSQREELHGNFILYFCVSANTLFMKFTDEHGVNMNGLPLICGKCYVLSDGATIRTARLTFYYNELLGLYKSQKDTNEISFNAHIPTHSFRSGKIALQGIEINENSGTLFGIMGGSGAGKTTLLNVLSGMDKSTNTSITINGHAVSSVAAKSAIGYIPQDDLLIEDLTVYQNLFYSASLSNRSWKKTEIKKRVLKVLGDLGLLFIRDIKVGNAMNKKISGGQRKRLNIALELIREPGVLFVDEPTSGLSSKDSENVMDLLKQLSQTGKIVFVVIHQPSSDIYKLFDKMFILDQGGLPVYYGNPIEAVIYFKSVTNQVNHEAGECESCGNVNPELLFSTLEDKEVDEFGNYTETRKISPQKWNELFKAAAGAKAAPTTTKTNLAGSVPPSRLKQFRIFFIRDLLSRLQDRQYLLIILLEAPLLSLILSLIIRKSSNSDAEKYIYGYNENVPAYIFMLIIVAMFIGLTISAEEIFKDRKIIKREKFLMLSRFSYLNSKITYLLLLSLFQSFSLCIIGNSIIGIQNMLLPYWLMIFTTFFFGNITGLLLSSTLKSIVSIYILIPIIIIPQMILGGAMFQFDNLSHWIGGGTRVPVVANFMASRWAYEGLMVSQYKDNSYEKQLYPYDLLLSKYNYRTSYLYPFLRDETEEAYLKKESKKHGVPSHVVNTVQQELQLSPLAPQDKKYFGAMLAQKSDSQAVNRILNTLDVFYQKAYNTLSKEKDLEVLKWVKKTGEKKYNSLKEENENERLSEIVQSSLNKNRTIVENDVVVQNYDQVFMTDHLKNNQLLTTNPMFVPYKKLGNAVVDTYAYNLIVLWLMIALAYIMLYFDWIGKILNR